MATSSSKQMAPGAQRATNKKDNKADQDPLLLPISLENPAGKNLRYAPLYDQIKQARLEEDASLPRGVWERKLKVADYKKVEDLCYRALSHETKDLQLVAWLMESWVVLYGAQGVRRGASMLAQFLQAFWEVTYPKLEDPLEPDLRLSPLVWLNEKFSAKVSAYLSILPPKNKEEVPLTLTVWQHAQEVEKQVAQSGDPQATKKSFQQAGGPSSEELKGRLKAASTPALLEFMALVHEVQEKLLEIEAFIKAHLPDVRFGFTKLKKIFKAYETLLQPYVAGKEAVVEKVKETDSAALEPTSKVMPTEADSLALKPKLGATPEVPQVQPGAGLLHKNLADSISSRKEAYGLLKQVSDYLMQLEPHSPSPYLIRKAIAWGDMSLEQLFSEIVEEGGDLQQFMRWVGMKKSPQVQKDGEQTREG